MRSLALAVLVMFTPAIAAAQPHKTAAPKTDPKLAEAKRLCDEGADVYSKGDYEQAIDAWQKSYDLFKGPLIFESIANGYERLGDPRKAREYLKKWREVAPKEEWELLDERIKNLDARIQREDEVAAQKAAADEAARKAQAEKDKQKEVKPPPPS